MNELKQILSDTFKRGDKYSRTSLTMFSAWFIVMFISVADYFMHGFNSAVYFGLLGVAMGSKITDSYSKKIHK